MRKLLMLACGTAVLSAALAGAAWAQQYPNVSTLTAFSAQTDFMSLPGYLRYLTYQQTQQWITYAEAQRVVAQQKGQ